MAWSAVELVLHDAVAAGSGLAGNLVFWEMQTNPSAPTTFVTLRRNSPVGLGSTVERTSNFNAANPAGSEVELSTKSHVEFTLGIQAYSPAVQGDSCALALLSSVQEQFDKRTQLDALAAAGIALVDRGTIQNVSALLNTQFEGRASLDMTFRVARGTLETTGYITEVDVLQTVDTTTTTVIYR